MGIGATFKTISKIIEIFTPFFYGIPRFLTWIAYVMEGEIAQCGRPNPRVPIAEIPNIYVGISIAAAV
jgi:hypothetical protein